MKTQPYHTVRNSKIHGRGVFAKRPIRKGVRVIEYTGPIIPTIEADKLGNTIDEHGHSHTMLFTVDDDRVIDGTRGGDAKYINHSCSPNCEAIQDGDQIFIESLRSIKKGEEITYDYHLVVEGKITDKIKKEYECFCGSPDCKHTQIDSRLIAKQDKKDKLKAAKKKAKAEKKRLKAELKKNKAEAKAKAKAEHKGKAKAEAKEMGKKKDGKKDKKKKGKNKSKKKNKK
jgi:uncharacterized protein